MTRVSLRILSLACACVLTLPVASAAQTPAAQTTPAAPGGRIDLTPKAPPPPPAGGPINRVPPPAPGSSLQPPGSGPQPESLERGHDPVFLGRPTRSSGGSVWLGPSAWIAPNYPGDAAIGAGGPALGLTIAWPGSSTVPTVGSQPEPLDPDAGR
jgi:hypothetical protein